MTMLIGFFLSPYIVRTIGVEANGFVTLANNFISYAALARTALNSMGSRFIMMAYYRNEHERVGQYYSSLFYGDTLLGLIMAVAAGICVWKLDRILEIPAGIVTDVKILFALLFTNSIVSTVTTAWNVAPYVRNKLYLDSINSAMQSVVRAIVIVGLFMSLSPSVCFVGIGSIVSGLVMYSVQLLYKTLLLPNVRATTKDFSWSTVWVLVSSGIWNSVSSLGNILVSGMDLLLANLFVSAKDMGVLALAKTFPGFIDNLNASIADVFTPSLIIDYAQGKTDEVIKTVRQSSKIISIICSLPLSFLLVYGKELFTLWQPTEDAEIIYELALITIFARIFFTGMQPLFNIFAVVNKVKQHSIVMAVNGLISILCTFVLLRATRLGVYAIAGTSVVCCIIKNFFFVIPYSAKYLGLKKRTFFFTVRNSIVPVILLSGIGSVEKIMLHGDSWLQLIIAGMIFACGGFALATFVILNHSEREYLCNCIKNAEK